jgi:hypothetical protein
MRIVRFVALAGLVAAPVAVHAQYRKPATSARIAGIAPAPVIVSPLGGPARFFNAKFFNGGFFTGFVPTIVSPEGRVFANFGAGFEEVVTTCGASTGVYAMSVLPDVIQPTVIQPSVIQPQIVGGLLPFSPPVPIPESATQQMLQAQQQVAVGNRVCWTTDGHGQMFVGRP